MVQAGGFCYTKMLFLANSTREYHRRWKRESAAGATGGMGHLLRNLDSLHFITGIIYPNRCDNEAYISETIDLTNINAYLKKKNETADFHYTLFQVIVAAIAKTITLRPKMNRFVANRNFYQRNGVSLSFVVKKQFSDHGAEALAVLHVKDGDTIEAVHDYIEEQVTFCRSEKVDSSTGAMDMLNSLPRFISKSAVRLLCWLDKHGWVPYSMIATTPITPPAWCPTWAPSA